MLFLFPRKLLSVNWLGVSRRAEPRYNCRPMGRTRRRFWLDVAGYQLLRDGRAVRLERQPMELLILLASRSGALVTRQEIAARFWGSDVFVDVDAASTALSRSCASRFRTTPTALDSSKQS